MTQVFPQAAPPTEPEGDDNGHGAAAPRPAPAVHQAGDAADRRTLPRIGTPMVALIALLVVLLLGALFVLGFVPRQAREAESDRDAAAARQAVAAVDVALPGRLAAAGELLLPGDTHAMQETAIYPRASGYLKAWQAGIGQRVNAGQLLAEIDTPEVDADLSQARATLDQAVANVAKAQTDADLAQATVARYDSVGTGGVSKQELDEKRAAVNQARAALTAASANVAAARAAVERLTSLQGFQKVTAPFAGRITARNYDVGALLSAGNATGGKEMFRLVQTDPIRVFVNVPQAYLAAIQVGQPAFFTVRNYPQRVFTGKVAGSTRSVDLTTRTVRFELHYPNADDALFPGMYGQVKFEVRDAQPPLTVPTSALVFGADGATVAVVRDGHVHFQKVAVGHDYGQQVEVTDGLSGTEQVVTNPGERLAEGVAVQPRTPAAEPRATGAASAR